ncbi:acylphosphatase [Mariprofundus erugo]|uniref:Acylphosphatase n=1 Tax=Mariprofundus erugo TaxID=2528639 RepID=A0A5R9GQY9_9PROT|nr:acylphosphatase [Mariprofundus erugo]TLS68676.1 acylphosphatase [Mariprofundus erugo]TLS77631.1 acylphosphatase [Mariprofundus erugo]
MQPRCLLLRISGRVQGVGFRYHTRSEAIRLGVTGWVRNLPDGRVEACICGSDGILEHMQQWLRHGPAMARVDDIEYLPATPTSTWTNFTILE